MLDDYINMKKQIPIIIGLAIIIIVIIISSSSITHDDPGSSTSINQGITKTGEFDGADQITGTNLQATYYIQKNEKQTYLLITASFDIDENDTAGIELAFPTIISVTEIIYNYQTGVDKGLSRMISTEPQDYTTSIEVGNVFHGSPSGGGHGSLIIKSLITDNPDDPFKIRLGLGSSGAIMYTTIKEIIINE